MDTVHSFQPRARDMSPLVLRQRINEWERRRNMLTDELDPFGKQAELYGQLLFLANQLLALREGGDGSQRRIAELERRVHELESRRR